MTVTYSKLVETIRPPGAPEILVFKMREDGHEKLSLEQDTGAGINQLVIPVHALRDFIEGLERMEQLWHPAQPSGEIDGQLQFDLGGA